MNMGDEIWTTKDGERIYVSDMTEQHAKNILRMLLRKLREKNNDEIDNIGIGGFSFGFFYKMED